MYSIQSYKKEYLRQVETIAELQFGKGYISCDDWFDKDRIILVAVKDEKVLGFCIAVILEYKNLAHIELQSVLTDSPVGMIKSLAVQPGQIRKGVGAKLLEAILRLLVEKGVSQFYTEAWRDRKGTRIEKIVLKNNFTKLIEKEDYWYSDSLKRNYQCSVCGQPCRCNAVVYYRRE